METLRLIYPAAFAKFTHLTQVHQTVFLTYSMGDGCLTKVMRSENILTSSTFKPIGMARGVVVVMRSYVHLKSAFSTGP